MKAGSAPDTLIQVKKAVSPVRYERLEWTEVTPLRTRSIIRVLIVTLVGVSILQLYGVVLVHAGVG